MTGGDPIGSAAAREVAYAFRYQVPDEFVRLPDPTASEGWREALAKLLPDADEAQLDSASDQMRASLPGLAAGGTENVVLTAMCLGTESVVGPDGVADERLSMGLLAVTTRLSDHRDRLLAAEGIYRAKERKFFAGETRLQDLDFDLGKGVQGRQDMLLAAKLPAGPGIMSASLRMLTLPAAFAAGTGIADVTGTDTETGTGSRTGSGEPVRPTVPMASLQLIVPAPRDYCVYVTLSTPSVFLLDSYCGRLAHIGRTFTFDVPDDES
ncbi:hypothetical protein ACIQNU_05285 [Streptomyces sp. NPDC091292]|uniref:hypothetical protein n=1 Tax=Streptomyces sp. NPDC091292 TaxID=3365991 RepID=UPI00380A8952